MGLIGNVMKSASGDCSNGGLSSKFNRVCIVNAEGPFAPREDLPAVKLVVRNLFGTPYVHAEPVELKGHAMFGGCLIDCSDSRFSAKVAELSGYAHGYPVKLHDRVEG